jgi:type IV pilus biogenesis protein CpaD/CtpE
MTIHSSHSLAAAAALLALLAAGCGSRQHMTENYGRSVGAAFSAQVANPQAGRTETKPANLDAQEARLVVKGYQRALSPKGSQTEDQGILILAPPSAANGQPYLPPPSVPQGK